MDSSKELFAKAHLVFTFIRGIYFLAEDDIRQNIKNFGITHTAFKSLWILYFDTKMSMTDLAYISQTNISNTYRQLIKLKDHNLVMINNGKDARIKEISLTENGRKFVHDIISKNVKATNLKFISILQKIPKEDLDKFINVASILSSELIGQRFTDWAIKTANTVKEMG
jgi:DNA-binding MarR family transcriptional regulator